MLRDAAKPPTIDNTKISGARMVKGMRSIHTNNGINARLIKTAAKLEM